MLKIRFMIKILLAIFLGGGLGSISRFAISYSITGGFKNINPVATIIANIAATIILGTVLFLTAGKHQLSEGWVAFLAVGFCGGFSTFSTFSYEIYELIRINSYGFAVMNLLLSIGLGVGVLFFLSKVL